MLEEQTRPNKGMTTRNPEMRVYILNNVMHDFSIHMMQ